MWIYNKCLMYPVRITKPDPFMAKLLLAQYAGPDSELGAAIRYATQRYYMPDPRVAATLTDIATEEMGHWEMLGSMIFQCLHNASHESLKAAGMDGYYVQHGGGVYPCDPNGMPFSVLALACTGDVIADLTEDMAADGTTA